jgi:hypothetical protein
MAIWSIQTFGIFCGHLVYFVAIWLFCGHLVYFVAIWYILWPFGIFLPRFGMLHPQKSGNPGLLICMRRMRLKRIPLYRVQQDGIKDDRERERMSKKRG